ncbi:DUF3993 domain-containing protein [Bacillus salitolerans]|uniref:DUF3993 domain-containing protein n=1 Tax=Bacillus salitolerans TaxID=1437434 RepID=A0ABW4LKP4_9BACI
MKKGNISVILTFLLVLFAINHPVQASNMLDKQGVKQLLKDAHEAQLSLTEKHHTWGEVTSKLYPYLSRTFAKDFLKEHVVYEEEGYIVYGTDFSKYVIPQLRFDEETGIVYSKAQNQIFIYEKQWGDGPVRFDAEYELVTIELNKEKWVIRDIEYVNDLPEQVLESNSPIQNKEVYQQDTIHRQQNPTKPNVQYKHSDASIESNQNVSQTNIPNKQSKLSFYEFIGIRSYPQLMNPTPFGYQPLNSRQQQQSISLLFSYILFY